MNKYEKAALLKNLRDNDDLINSLFKIRRQLVAHLSREEKNELIAALYADHKPHYEIY